VHYSAGNVHHSVGITALAQSITMQAKCKVHYSAGNVHHNDVNVHHNAGKVHPNAGKVHHNECNVHHSAGKVSGGGMPCDIAQTELPFSRHYLIVVMIAYLLGKHMTIQIYCRELELEKDDN
jgi:hypothetical protein